MLEILLLIRINSNQDYAQEKGYFEVYRPLAFSRAKINNLKAMIEKYDS